MTTKVPKSVSILQTARLGLEMVNEFSQLICGAEYAAEELKRTDAWGRVADTMRDGTMASYSLAFEEIMAAADHTPATPVPPDAAPDGLTLDVMGKRIGAALKIAVLNQDGEFAFQPWLPERVAAFALTGLPYGPARDAAVADILARLTPGAAPAREGVPDNLKELFDHAMRAGEPSPEWREFVEDILRSGHLAPTPSPARSDRAAEGQGVPAGWKLVPIEPTETMYDAGYDATREPDGTPQFSESGFVLGHAGNIFRAMLAVAPEPPAALVAAPTPASEGVDLYDMDGLTLAQRLDKEEREWSGAVENAYDEDGPGVMPGDVEGMFHRIRDAAGLNTEHTVRSRLAQPTSVPAETDVEALRVAADIRDKAENLVIAIGGGWNVDDEERDALKAAGRSAAPSAERSAEALVAERGSTHGDFADHARDTQSLKRALRRALGRRKARGQPDWSDEMIEAVEMILHKIGRATAGQADFKDHWDDMAGYATLVSQRVKEQ